MPRFFCTVHQLTIPFFREMQTHHLLSFFEDWLIGIETKFLSQRNIKFRRNVERVVNKFSVFGIVTLLQKDFFQFLGLTFKPSFE